MAKREIVLSSWVRGGPLARVQGLRAYGSGVVWLVGEKALGFGG